MSDWILLKDKHDVIRKAFRKRLKERGLPYNIISIRGDRGTDYGWLNFHIKSTTKEERMIIEEIFMEFGLFYGHYNDGSVNLKTIISPDNKYSDYTYSHYNELDVLYNKCLEVIK